MLNEDERERLALLSDARVPVQFVKDVYGVSVENRKFQQHLGRIAKGRPSLHSDEKPGYVSRFAFEYFLQLGGLMTPKQAGLRIGTTEKDVLKLLAGLAEATGIPVEPIREISHLEGPLVPEESIRTLPQAFDGLRSRVFFDHNDWCNGIHSAVEATLGWRPEPIYCEVASCLELEDCDFAIRLDPVRLVPVGIRFQVWLDNGKPVFLEPDAVSLLTFDLDQSLFAGKVYSDPVGRHKDVLAQLRAKRELTSGYE